MYNENTIFIIGDAKASQNNPITKKFNQFFLAFVVDRTDGKIIDVECSATVNLTIRFIQSIFINRFMDDPIIVEDINQRYFGASQKALIVAYQDALKKYQTITALSK
ncbi:DUF3870 domain-containing protein [Heyndrickxia oleronia]|uniref:DUF3870 domain-containing protein n=1 Tax=Heyndrickxia oleronia TaxID=38875 RepID=A0A8E2IDK0_9BACI|nr:DUF3870 domain-containing protein [Heyndrickxia oleronia]OJH18377.1 hypothetical protein BLX88_13840 [Bacillus obstructivus]MCM3239223.1 DUF3870 domain-containing protein [Heyndrickxia oleronia]MEC1373243.1 DUF3870 domain-containing protein [Heyndrickxia oleronia]OOP67951.1 hypothetical protein BWZ43_13210 [Heyndrickxia oleronia]QQZ04453.1 DUF3870 domain-containing protein [Heyndrickxia oleronia]